MPEKLKCLFMESSFINYVYPLKTHEIREAP